MSNGSNPSSPPEERWSEHIRKEVHDIIRRAAWHSAKSTEDVAPHQYVVIGWDRDDVTEDEFWLVVTTIQTLGRLEEWTPPAEWVRRWGGKPQRNHYLYVGDYAYWLTRTGVWMLNREHVSVQEATPTRRVIGERSPQLQLEEER
jgi:hypothetical protein